MKDKGFAARQQEVLDIFFREMFAKSVSHLGHRIVTGIMVFGLGVFMFIPYQEMSRDGDFSVFPVVWLGFMTGISYIQPYMQYNEWRKTGALYDKLKYLPLSAELFRRYRYKKLLKFLTRVFAVCLAGQLFFSIVCFHEVIWANIWSPFLFAFLGPLVVTGAYLRLVK